MNTLINRELSVFSNGKWVHAHGAKIDVFDPSTGKVFASIKSGNAEDVAAAAQAAASAFDAWKYTKSEIRGRHLTGFADGLEKRMDALVELQMRNNGKPKMEAEIDVGDAIATFRYYATLAEKLDGSQDASVAHEGGEHHGLVRHEAVGPVGMIVPWNFPLVTAAWKIAPALAAGCTVVLKPSEITPFADLVYGDIALEIGLPAGVLNLVTGNSDVGIAITSDRNLRKISFTGSNMIGAKVMEAVSKRCLPISLELGGKAPIIVTADADIDLAVDCIMGGIYFNAGQICSATSRLIVDRSIEDKLIEALVSKTKAMQVASPQNDNSEMGPITTRAQFDKVGQYLQQANSEHLDCLTGGNTLDLEGNFIAPTIYRNVPHDSAIWREEIFGPVLATTTSQSDEDAIRIGNDTQYGLVGSVISGDWERAKRIADKIEAGQIWINTPQIVYPDSVWGGFKASGIGRELGPWGLGSYQGVKHILSPS